jgi:hypothetical protein
MTVCLAAVCDQGRSIITASDTQFSSGYDAAYAGKVEGIHRDWQLLFAGDVAKCELAIDWIHRTTDARPKGTDQMLAIVEAACAKHALGKGEIREFLVAGFDPYPRLMVTVEEGRKPLRRILFDRIGYAAIGSGALIANHHLRLYQPNRTRSIAWTAYACCAAKFFSEGADGVSPDTHVYCFQKGLADLRLMSLLPEIRDAWSAEGQPPVPSGVVERITKQLSREPPTAQ